MLLKSTLKKDSKWAGLSGAGGECAGKSSVCVMLAQKLI